MQEVSRVGAQGVTSKSKLLALQMPCRMFAPSIGPLAEYRPRRPLETALSGANEPFPRGERNVGMGGPLTAPLRTIPTASSPPPNDVANGIALHELSAEIDTTVSVGATGRGARGSRPLAAIGGPRPCATHIESFYRERLHKAADLSDVDAVGWCGCSCPPPTSSSSSASCSA